MFLEYLRIYEFCLDSSLQELLICKVPCVFHHCKSLFMICNRNINRSGLILILDNARMSTVDKVEGAKTSA